MSVASETSRAGHAELTGGGGIEGERSEPVVAQVQSVQARISWLLALGLVALVGFGGLIWYYAAATSQRLHTAKDAREQVSSAAQSESQLPSLGRIDPPHEADDQDGAAMLAPDTLALAPAPGAALGVSGASGPASGAALEESAQRSPEQLALERRLAGPAFSRAATESAAAQAAAAGATSGPPSTVTALQALLRPTTAAAAQAQMLPEPRFLLPKGAFIDCTLETAIDSTLPGMTTCITATDSFSADGKVVLLERGTKLIGETQGQVQQGMSRIFVLWDEARTPAGIVVPLASPGTDALGRSGLSGHVNRHFWDRFGAAILLSTLDGAVQASGRSRSGTIIYDPTGSQAVMSEVLKGTLNIAPTLYKAQGDRIQVLVARDLDFRTVYELRTAASER